MTPGGNDDSRVEGSLLAIEESRIALRRCERLANELAILRVIATAIVDLDSASQAKEQPSALRLSLAHLVNQRSSDKDDWGRYWVESGPSPANKAPGEQQCRQ